MVNIVIVALYVCEMYICSAVYDIPISNLPLTYVISWNFNTHACHRVCQNIFRSNYIG